jgi:hypothetical protein
MKETDKMEESYNALISQKVSAEVLIARIIRSCRPVNER